MIERNWLGAVFCLPLALLLWQGSSCHSTDSNPNNNSVRPGTNVNVNKPQLNNNIRTAPAAVDLIGVWGGDHVSMEVTENGASIEYDCANGTISEKIVLRRDGHFDAHGSHRAEHGGPSRLNDEEDKGQPATYRGSVSGDKMELTVVLSKSDETVGNFTLTHGKSGRIWKCR